MTGELGALTKQIKCFRFHLRGEPYKIAILFGVHSPTELRRSFDNQVRMLTIHIGRPRLFSLKTPAKPELTDSVTVEKLNSHLDWAKAPHLTAIHDPPSLPTTVKQPMGNKCGLISCSFVCRTRAHVSPIRADRTLIWAN